MLICIIGFLSLSLAPCPNTPNCVSSQATDEKHFIQPFEVLTTPQNDLQIIVDIIKSMPRTKIIRYTNNYIHAEFRSKVFKFVDDVEFLYDPQENIINVRSSSQLGYSDFGVNRDRIESIYQRYIEENQL
jgi:uncharacterized protein (DUF1499 family)